MIAAITDKKGSAIVANAATTIVAIAAIIWKPLSSDRNAHRDRNDRSDHSDLMETIL